MDYMNYLELLVAMWVVNDYLLTEVRPVGNVNKTQYPNKGHYLNKQETSTSVKNVWKKGNPVITKQETIVDYALPCMMAEKALKDCHNAVLEQNLDQAMTKAMDAVVQSRVLYTSLRHMKEQQQ